ncbi:uncharacterized protein LOC121972331 [Zingiber officinale]|uniref:uncharacterized protein LOC121972331 n=1 Tax=Zingiber officinale TaxID=94328 RepID=UPI001C4D9CB8|nr:uncharacterized protein LOC121972331 [Zingiber officinale]
MDEYPFKTPGSIPFKWEIKPGLPKSTVHSNSSGNSPPENLIPPPCMCMASVSLSKSRSLSDSTSNNLIGTSSPSIGRSSFFWHKEIDTFFHRSSLHSPSRQAAKAQPSIAQLQATWVPPGCFHVPSLKRKDYKNNSNGVKVSSPCRTRMSSATSSPSVKSSASEAAD